MMNIIRRLFILYALMGGVSISDAQESSPQSIVLATTDWCPYACPNNAELPGIAHEYISAIFAELQIPLQIKFYPWARAIELANKGGQVDGLLTAVKTEAPQLLFTSTPTMSYTVCLFTRPDNNWQYQNEQSLSAIKLGVIQNYGYGEPVDSYLAQKEKSQNIISIAGNEGIGRLFSMLDLKRVDAVIDDQFVVGWMLKQQHKHISQYKNAGCLDSNPFYIALNPNTPGASSLMAQLDKALKQPERANQLNALIQKYTQ